MPYDIESQDPTSLDLYDTNHTSPPSPILLPTPISKRAARFSTHISPNNIISPSAYYPSQPNLGPVPAVIKSANGNLFWADESCVRRVGLTCHEARLFLQLQLGNYNYGEYAEMFHAFGEEKKNLQERLEELPWWRVERKRVWEKRVEWLGRLEEPRLWLLYLMARRRRILWVACRKILGRLREKRDVRVKDLESREVRSQRDWQVPTIKCPMVSTGSQTSDSMKPGTLRSYSGVSEDTQTGDVASSLMEPTSNNISHLMPSDQPSSRPDISMSTHTHNSHPHSHSHSHKPSTSSPPRLSTQTTHTDSNPHSCPIFTRPFSATTTSIRLLTALLLPPPTPYLILGYFPTSTLDPHETYLPLSTPSSLFSSLHRAEHSLRGYRRFLSLKSLAGFGLYKCDIEKGAHVKVILGEEEKMVLRRFFAAFRDKGGRGLGLGVRREEWDEDVGRAWMGWVVSNMNGGMEGSGQGAGGPLEGRWSLELVYDWCPYRLSAVVITPLLLSLVVGTWYMEAGGDVITAWTLALYIVTAAAAIVALLGIIGSLKDVVGYVEVRF
ncbi:hypothetical protein SBOR_9556 [Sclerotinia borealis F-4128]|uniref:Uncharacterized protein n=1 Tax=Sclerotinia borealis (strain F-4128) TaxID=1432307 RepID=W9C2Y2_SCLBF|nr:hypothetical protein SBOR_9556 [Sclerotinia borealis F-4128]